MVATPKALVDAGSTFTVIPASLARMLGLKPSGGKVRVSPAKGYQDLPSLTRWCVSMAKREPFPFC